MNRYLKIAVLIIIVASLKTESADAIVLPEPEITSECENETGRCSGELMVFIEMTTSFTCDCLGEDTSYIGRFSEENEYSDSEAFSQEQMDELCFQTLTRCQDFSMAVTVETRDLEDGGPTANCANAMGNCSVHLRWWDKQTSTEYSYCSCYAYNGEDSMAEQDLESVWKQSCFSVDELAYICVDRLKECGTEESEWLAQNADSKPGNRTTSDDECIEDQSIPQIDLDSGDTSDDTGDADSEMDENESRDTGCSIAINFAHSSTRLLLILF